MLLARVSEQGQWLIMIDILFWFLVGQTISGLPAMLPGTEVRVVSADLLTVYTTAFVVDNNLFFDNVLEPNAEVQILILSPNQDPKEVNALDGKALHAFISPTGDDILLKFDGMEGSLSFKNWLLEERNIVLHLVPTGGVFNDESN